MRKLRNGSKLPHQWWRTTSAMLQKDHVIDDRKGPHQSWRMTTPVLEDRTVMEKSHTSDDAEGPCQWWWERTTSEMENDHTSVREGPHQCQRRTTQWWRRATAVAMQKDHTSHEEKPTKVDDEALPHALSTGEQWPSPNNLLCLLIASLHMEQRTQTLILGTVKNYGKRYRQPKLLVHEDHLIHFLQNPYFGFSSVLKYCALLFTVFF